MYFNYDTVAVLKACVSDVILATVVRRDVTVRFVTAISVVAAEDDVKSDGC